MIFVVALWAIVLGGLLLGCALALLVLAFVGYKCDLKFLQWGAGGLGVGILLFLGLMTFLCVGFVCVVFIAALIYRLLHPHEF